MRSSNSELCKRWSRVRLLMTAGSLAALVSCGKCGGPSDPEAQVRATMKEIQEAAAASEIAVLREHVSQDYKDGAGRDREAIMGLLTFHYLRHRSHYVFSIVRDVAMYGPTGAPDHARVETLVALAGQRISSAAELANISANLFRFTFLLRREDGDWRCIHAEWERALANDFL